MCIQHLIILHLIEILKFDWLRHNINDRSMKDIKPVSTKGFWKIVLCWYIVILILNMPWCVTHEWYKWMQYVDVRYSSEQIEKLRNNSVKVNLWKWFLSFLRVHYFRFRWLVQSSLIILNKKAFLSSEHPVVEIPLRRV